MMNDATRERLRYRTLLILASEAQETTQLHAILSATDVPFRMCADAAALGHEVNLGCGAVLVSEAALAEGAQALLMAIAAAQPGWSDLPLLVLAREGVSAFVEGPPSALGNATLLERPLRAIALTSAVRTALRSRVRQCESRSRVEEQGLLAAIVASSDDAIISKTLDGIITSWNGGAERLLGYTADEIIGRSVVQLIPPDRLAEETMIIQRIKRGERISHYETVRVAKSGARVDISLTVSPVRDADNRIVGASKSARDITRSKQLELALREADRRKDEFLATLAHELRNPLAPIRYSLHIMRLAGQPDAAGTQAREVIERQIEHMVRLVDDLLAISRISRGTIVLRKERIDLGVTIGVAVEAVTPLIEAAGQTLSLEVPDAPLFLEADPVRLTQIVTNLLNNASNHTARGGAIWLCARCEDNQAVVSVRDNGVGIAPQLLPRVFEMFVQLHAPLHERDGLGIGLTLVSSLVELHGGKVFAYSEGVGTGSEFVVQLPLAVDSTPPVAAQVSTPAEATLPPMRVLVVDDNQDAADTLGLLLRLMGLTVLVCYDGPQALNAIPTFSPAAVLLDIGMPGMNGYEVADRIRRDPMCRESVLVAITGFGQDADRLRARAAGFDHHLVKPVDTETLRSLMAAIGEHESRSFAH